MSVLDPKNGTYSETLRTARKTHWCAGCFSQIPAGCSYTEIRGYWEGWRRVHMHTGCLVLYWLVMEEYSSRHCGELSFQDTRDAAHDAGLISILAIDRPSLRFDLAQRDSFER